MIYSYNLLDKFGNIYICNLKCSAFYSLEELISDLTHLRYHRSENGYIIFDRNTASIYNLRGYNEVY